jgi:hypothetical protein
MTASHSTPQLEWAARQTSLSTLLSVATLLWLGCDTPAEPPPKPAALASCRAGWQPLTEARTAVRPDHVVLHGDELVYQGLAGSDPGQLQIEAQPLAGGTPRVVASAAAETLWLEGDQLYFAHQTDLFRVPVAGGTPTAVVSSEWKRSVFGHLMTPNDFIWWILGGDSLGGLLFEIWAQPRAGGAPRLVATTSGGGITRIELAGPLLLTDGSPAEAIPLDGGPNLALDSKDLFVSGLEPEGVYGFAAVAFDPPRHVVKLAPADGGPARPVFPDFPARAAPEHIWSDGQGGWLAAGKEPFDDGQLHESVFWIDGTGHARRAACDPELPNLEGLDARPVFTADAAYLVVSRFVKGSASWSFVMIPRTP